MAIVKITQKPYVPEKWEPEDFLARDRCTLDSIGICTCFVCTTDWLSPTGGAGVRSLRAREEN